jgi:hypothetical protein
MDFKTFVTERLASLTANYNAIGTNAKKIDELPVQANLDPASKIHVSRGGNSESLTVQKIINAVSSGSYDKLLAIGEIELVGNVATIPANAQWKIGDTYYGNIAAIERTIPYCATGFSRKDILVANTSNDIVLVQGPETAGEIVIAPNIPIDTVFITEMDVTDSTVGTPTIPIITDDFVLKRESQDYLINYFDAVVEEVYLSDERASLSFTGSNTDVKSIRLSEEFMRLGKLFTLKNRQTIPVTFWHNSGTGNVKMLFPNEENFVLNPNEIIQFSLNINDSSTPKLEYIGVAGGVGLPIDITDVTGLTAELADRYTKSEVDAKVASVYVFKGNVANYAALPSTGLTIGDVYNLTDTGENYAWTGTVWDNLGTTIDVSGKENASNKTAAVTGNEASTSLYLNILGAVNYFQQKLTDSIFGTFINSLTGKSTPIDADSISIVDTGDGNKQKKVSLTNFKAFLKTYFDTQYKTDTQSFAISDLTSALVTGDVHVGYAAYNFTITSFWIGAKTAPTISSLVVDVKKNGTSITSTKAGIDATELTSLTGTAPVLTTTSFTKGDLITANIYQVGSGETGRGLQLYLEIIKT